MYDESRVEANRFKWIESEKAGYDLGEGAVRGWVKDHWNGFLRARWLEHLQGKEFWIELDRGDYGLLEHEFQEEQDLLDDILQRLKGGQENLDVLCWALSTHIPMEPVRKILKALDINSLRLVTRFEPCA